MLVMDVVEDVTEDVVVEVEAKDKKVVVHRVMQTFRTLVTKVAVVVIKAEVVTEAEEENEEKHPRPV